MTDTNPPCPLGDALAQLDSAGWEVVRAHLSRLEEQLAQVTKQRDAYKAAARNDMEHDWHQIAMQERQKRRALLDGIKGLEADLRARERLRNDIADDLKALREEISPK